MNFLWRILEERLGKNFDSDSKIARAVLEVSRSFTGDRKPALGQYLREEELRTGYLAYFLPLNAAKTFFLLKRHLDPKSPPLKILDFGCGPGTASLAYLGWYAETKMKNPITIMLVDHETKSLDLAQKTVRQAARDLKIDVSVHTLPKICAENDGKILFETDLILAVNVLNELPAEKPVFEDLLKSSFSKTRKILIIEPSHRVASQKLIRLRKRLLSHQSNGHFTHVLGPCTHAQECPLFRTRNWCHFSDKIEDVRLVEMGRKIFKSSRDWMKYSYLFLEQNEQAIQDRLRPEKNTSLRAIGDLHLTRRGTYAIDVCTPGKKLEFFFPRTIPANKKKTLFRGALIRSEVKLQK